MMSLILPSKKILKDKNKRERDDKKEQRSEASKRPPINFVLMQVSKQVAAGPQNLSFLIQLKRKEKKATVFYKQKL